ncbi:MAG TPA: bifunctional UDP-N-acetylglucosamine diphosphorylase/glucosamine-1-phosphate N-acetyltransferase GlmU [Actinomycetota bacterium]|nr:bifunctional UDP-N-acetylglucosamine diphosphorylase/glucosamine-1-phosphate N-acetyltransferase GlmU [Actinomycetota bacterium]
MAQPPRTGAVVLAAGGGTRLKSDLPKVLHPAAGRPLLAHVLAALAPLELVGVVVVASTRRAEIEDAMAAEGLSDGVAYTVQDPPRGTADALRVGLDAVAGACDEVVVVPGDAPLLEASTLARLVALRRASGAAGAMLTASVHEPAGYGRVVRGDGDLVERVVEDRDATPQQRRIHEVNGGVYTFDVARVAPLLAKVDRDNAQGEYYLTDVVALLRGQDERVVALETHADEIAGVNDRAQLAFVSGLMRHRVCERWMAEGVSIVDPRTTYIDTTVVIERDATIHPFTFLEGSTSVAAGAEVGPQARVVDSEIAEGATVSFALVRSSRVGPEASVGPFASLRPGTVLERGSRIGTFVESKNATLGEDSKANHLAYLGDASIGRGVNVGAGTITCNWDGRAKHATVIDDDAYIGSDTMLVAPVRVGRRAATGAGSVVRDDVPDDALAVGVPARVIENAGNRMERTGADDENPRQ